jgi:Fe-S-cluster containining protein
LDETVFLTDEFDRLFEILDKKAQEAIQKVGGVSCKKGCAHCCYLLATLTLTEGLNIAERLLVDESIRPRLGELLEALKRNAIAASYKNVTRENYFEKKLRCPFLTDQNECSIYPFRPSMCRYHFVSSPPENCSPDAPKGTSVRLLNLIHLEKQVWMLDAEFRQNQAPVCAPISITVLWAMKKIVDESDMSGETGTYIKNLVDKANDGVMSPHKWIAENADSIISESKSRIEKAHQR